MHRTVLTRNNVFKNLSMANPPPISSFVKKPTLITKQKLEREDLKKLFRHEITALQVKSFYPAKHAQKIANELQQKATDGNIDNWRVITEKGLQASDVFTEGDYVPYNVAVATDTVDEYFEGVQKDLRRRRMVTSEMIDDDSNTNDSIDLEPRLWPLDLLRLELDEVWEDGAGLARSNDDNKRVMGSGLPRIMIGPTRWKKGFIHTDQYSPLNKMEGLFSGNIYLQVPQNEEADKGHLQIWDLEIFSQLDWHRYQDILRGLTEQDASLQIKLRKALGEPLNIHVESGDLVMLCVQKPHCAVGFMDGTRISLQCFLQYREEERILIDI